MLTPRFELSQNDSELMIKIHALYANIKDSEVHVDGTDFVFYASPYYLRLNLPGEIEENDSSTGSYDADKGIFHLKFSKITKGQVFENLDMITSLLAPKKNEGKVFPNIEVIGNPAVADNIEDDEDDWYYPQSVNPISPHLSTALPKYGFANQKFGILGQFDVGFIGEIINLPNPDSTPLHERKRLRLAEEKMNFSDDHYSLNFIEANKGENEGEDDYNLTTLSISSVINFVPEWCSWAPENIVFTPEEQDVLKELSNKEYLLNARRKVIINFGLVDILYACCYNYRIEKGVNSPESAWNINKISATLSWLDVFSSMEEVLVTCYRRSLVYPYYRNWELSTKVFEDVKAIVKLGKKAILKRFIEVYKLFNNSFEPRYILNQMYIQDYLIYLQQLSDSYVTETIYNELEKVSLKKEDVGLDLIELEAAIQSVIEEQTETDDNKEEIINAKLLTKNFRHFVNDIAEEIEALQVSSGDDDDDQGEHVSLMNKDNKEKSGMNLTKIQLDETDSDDSDDSDSTTSSSCSSSSSSSSDSSSSSSTCNECGSSTCNECYSDSTSSSLSSDSSQKSSNVSKS